jgi:hypothetical protein
MIAWTFVMPTSNIPKPIATAFTLPQILCFIRIQFLRPAINDPYIIAAFQTFCSGFLLTAYFLDAQFVKRLASPPVVAPAVLG